MTRGRTFRTLLFSSLYPSSVRPNHGIFVETRLRHLLASGRVETKVVAPVPWFPSRNPRFGSWAKLSAIPRFERHNDIEVWHPRYALPPKVGMNVAPYVMAMGARSTIAELIHQGWDFDLIDAHYYYPDGVAAGILARWFNKPFVVTARGTDLNLISQYAWPRKLILRTAAEAAASIGVSQSLVNALSRLGAASEKLHVMRNGVDLQRFRPESKTEARKALGLNVEAPTLLSVGNLVELKGHHIVIAALASRSMPKSACLIIAGEGPQREELIRYAHERGVQDRVIFTGLIPNLQLARLYCAADLLVLASSREGWPNVLLEAMACDTPVVATLLESTPEIVQNRIVGRLVPSRSGESFGETIAGFLNALPGRGVTRGYAENFSWESTTQAQLNLFREICGG